MVTLNDENIAGPLNTWVYHFMLLTPLHWEGQSIFSASRLSPWGPEPLLQIIMNCNE